MSGYFKRQIQLWGEDVQEKLSKKTIVIVGCGGLGCSLGIALGSSGIGKIYLVDFDTISLDNIHRQIAFQVSDEGKYKCEILSQVLKGRVLDGVDIEPMTCGFDEFVKKDISFDLILDATDNLQTRDEIDKYSKQTGKPWVYASVEEYNGQACFYEKTNFSDTFKISKPIPKGQTAPMVMQMASFSANLALRYLAGFSVKKDSLYYLFFNENGEFTIQNFKLPL